MSLSRQGQALHQGPVERRRQQIPHHKIDRDHEAGLMDEVSLARDQGNKDRFADGRDDQDG
jgi:hypothetical protein